MNRSASLLSATLLSIFAKPGWALEETWAAIRYFLSSFSGEAAWLAQAIRRHWSIENSLHWVLDVTFWEDDSRLRDPTVARNFALLRKMALNLVSRDRSTKTSLGDKRKKAAWDDHYMQQLLWG